VQDTLSRTLQSQKFDASWVSRELAIGYPTFERLLKKPVAYDIDDAVFLGTKARTSGIRCLIERAKVVLAGNRYLADYCRQYSSNVKVVPTAVDVHRFSIPNRKENNKLVLGWSGTSSSYSYFIPIENTLAEFLKTHSGALLRICSDRFPHELVNLAPYVHFEPWSASREVKQIQGFDVGIMPLEDSEWVRGKCSYKMLLYAACGIPTITSAYGMNNDVLKMGRIGLGCESTSQWSDALSFVFESRNSLPAVFPDCRNVVVQHFSLDVVADQIACAMGQL
jgi:glycosyltransferase involved in cell wall biosynthesis